MLAAALPASLAWTAPAPANYGYPIADRYDATVIGTPTEFSAKLPEKIPVSQYALPNITKMPDLFWYNDGLRFSVVLQDRPAPLVFNIAGTGAAHDSAKLVMMQKALYQAGFHVINIGSPTELNFQLAASSSHIPGYTPDDVQDIYRVMQQAYRHVKEKKDFEATGFHVAGYSLGAMHAAFIAELDQRERKIGIRKAFMINPPVNLYNSAVILDKLFTDIMPVVDGLPRPGIFLDKVIQGLAKSYDPAAGMTFNSDFLYNAYLEQKDDGIFKSDATPEGLIGFAFRLTSSAMTFTADVMTHAGYIVPREKVFTANESLAPYARKSTLVTLQEYIDDMVIPSVQARHPGKSRETVLRDASLRSIEAFLRSSANVRVVTNRDEIILADGEMAYLQEVMGDRMTVYPLGGHCGNMAFTTNVDDMIAFFKAGDAQ
jgi:pimeloyl-ACP methyl ester carboxylesterase